MKSAGLIIILVGVVLTIFTAFKFFTKEKVIDVGPIEITKQMPHYFSWSPVFGIVILVVGILVFVQGSKKM
jgi:uncharacterized membrane protein YidH (DUF202 family)